MQKSFTTKEKEQISALLLAKFKASEFKESAVKFATSIGLKSSSDITNLQKENWKTNPSCIGDQKWAKFADVVGFIHEEKAALTDWVYVQTWYNAQMYRQFDMCRNLSELRTLTDMPGIGKTVSAKRYTEQNSGVYYIPCYEFDTNTLLIRELASKLGIKAAPTRELRTKIVKELKTRIKDKPLIVLDEAGDLSDSGVRLIKYLYNELVDEGYCGIYIIGSDGLEKQLMSGKINNRHGFTEAMSRMDNKTIKILKTKPEGEKRELLAKMAAQIALANGADEALIAKIKEDVRKDVDLRKVRSAIRKHRYNASEVKK